MNQDLLTAIITRLLASPELQALLDANPASAEQATKPGCLILVTSQADATELPALTERYRPDYAVAACVIGQVELPDSPIRRVAAEQVLQAGPWQRLHIPACSREQLAHIALGLGGDPTGQLAAWAITRGIPVEIGKINWDFTEQTPASYRQLFAGYAAQVAGFGVIMADMGSGQVDMNEKGIHDATNAVVPQPPAAVLNLVAAPPQAGFAASLPPAQTTSRYEQRLLGGKEAGELADSKTVRIAKTTVLTPAAIDIFKQKKTEVYREGVRCI